MTKENGQSVAPLHPIVTRPCVPILRREVEVGTVDNLEVPKTFSLRGTVRRRGVGVVAKATVGN